VLGHADGFRIQLDRHIVTRHFAAPSRRGRIRPVCHSSSRNTFPATSFKIEKSGTKEDVIRIRQVPAPRGVLAIKASTTVEAFPLRVRRIWWTMEVRRQGIGDDGGFHSVPVWNDDYHHQAITLAAGHSTVTTFEERLQMPPGHYGVWLQVHEDIPNLDANGIQIADHNGLQGLEARMDVN
jgi:hypothetical protein